MDHPTMQGHATACVDAAALYQRPKRLTYVGVCPNASWPSPGACPGDQPGHPHPAPASRKEQLQAATEPVGMAGSSPAVTVGTVGGRGMSILSAAGITSLFHGLFRKNQRRLL